MSNIKFAFAAFCWWASAQSTAAPPAEYGDWTITGPVSTPAPSNGGTVSEGFQRATPSSTPPLHAGTIVTDGGIPTSYASPGGCFRYSTSGVWSTWGGYARGPYIFMPTPASDAVVPYDTKDNSSGNPIATGDTPYGVVISSDGRYAYVSNRGEGSVSVIDILKSDVIKTYATGSNPAGVALNADERELYVANETDGTLTVISNRSGSTLATVPLGINPHVVVSKNGEVYVLDRQHGDLAIVAADRRVDVMHLAQATFGMARDMVIDPAGRTLYVTLQNPTAMETRLVAIDIESRSERQWLALPGLPKGLVANLSGTHLYVAVDAASQECAELRSVAVGSFTVGDSIALDHGIDGMTLQFDALYVVNNVTNQLVPISTTDFSVMRPLTLQSGVQVLGDFYGDAIRLAIDFSPNPIKFDTAAADEIVKKTVTVANKDVVPFTINRLNVRSATYFVSPTNSGTVQPHFSISDNQCRDAVLAPGEHCTLEIAFVPGASGFNVAELEYLTTPDANDSGTVTPPAISIHGTRAQAVADVAASNTPEAVPGGSSNPGIVVETAPQTGGGGGAVYWLELFVLLGGWLVRKRTRIA